MKPILNRVTITGADDSVDPKDLKRLQDEFPFVEWGILVSEHRTLDGGCARFPSSSFLARLDPALQLNLSVHLCGRWVRQVCKADWSWLDKSFDVGMLLGQAQRVQLNFHSYIHKVDREQLAKDLQNYLAPRQVICQVDGVNDDIVSHLYDDGCDVAALYDSSSGAGKLPSTWLVPLVGIPCGYAGGLSPENVEEQLELLSAFVKEAIWIDVETRVRSDDDQQFDFDRVHAFLEKTAPWVVKQGTTDAVKILHDRYVGDDPVRQMALEAERRLADEEQRRYDAGELTDEDF